MNTTTSQLSVRTVTDENDTAKFTLTLVEAFREDPAARWLFPADDRYDESFTRFAKAFAGPAFANHTAHFIPGFSGAAAWFAPGAHSDDEAVIKVLEEYVSSDRLEEAFGVFGQMDAFHPTEQHWYLPLIGVVPAMQNHGLGSVLLRHTLEECDRTDAVAYLESSSAANLPLYRRHGFHQIGEIQSGSSPVLYPMLRDPR
jgi:GNAT superfamily N-acetyltransferase